MEYCKNCGKPVKDLYCSHCGQKIVFERISFLYIWHQVFHFFTHIEHGFLYTSIRMLSSPGKTITTYIDGKRKVHQPPVSYFLIWTTIFILFLYWMDNTFGHNTVIDYKDYWGPSGATTFAISHLNIVLTIIVPFQALYLFLLITRKKYNYSETLVAAIYMVGTIILLQFVFALTALILYAFSHQSVDLQISDILKLTYFIWFIIDFSRLFPVKARLLRASAFILLATATFTVWRLYGVPELIRILFDPF